MFINLTGNKIKALVIGGGRAAFIKINTLLKNNVDTQCVSKTINKDIQSINNKNLKIEKAIFKEELLENKHLIIIAIDEDILIDEIISLCEKKSIIYIVCKNPENGNAIMSSEGSLNNIAFGVNTKGKNPKASVFIKNIIEENIKPYDEFIGEITSIRNKLKNRKDKDCIINFITSEDFKYFYEKKKMGIVLSLFFSKNIIDILSK